MERLQIGGIDLTYELRLQGEPVVLLHASPFVEWYGPLLEHLPGLSTLLYHRHLADRPDGGLRPFSVADDARLCSRLLDHVGWDRVHAVGHSYGALVAMQLAIQAPERVSSIALLEPAASGVLPVEQVGAEVVPVIDAYRAGDKETAVDLFLQMVCGPGYRDTLEQAVPGAFEAAVARADVFFQVETPALRAWRFGPQEASQIASPVLNVRGAESAPRLVAASDLVQTWFPEATTLRLPDVGHFLMVERPKEIALGLADFIHQ